MSVNEYALKIKSICESLASINVKLEDDGKVEIFLRRLGSQYKSFKTSILTRDSIPSFTDLVSMLVVEERNLIEDTKETLKMRGKLSTIVLEEAEEEAMTDLVQQELIIIIKEKGQ